MSKFADQDLVEISGNPYGCSYNEMAEMASELLELRADRDLLRERDEARAAARILAHAYEHDTRPPAKIVARALEWPVSDADVAKAHSK